VATRWPSSLPPRPSPVTGRGPRGLPRCPGRSVRGPSDASSSGLLLLQSSLTVPGLGHPLLGFVRFCLSSDMRPSVHSRVPLPASFGRTMQLVRSRSVSAVSHRSDGFLRSAVAGLLRPAAGHEVHRVSGFRTEDPKVLGLVCRPHGAVHTPRRIPLVGSRSASLRSLPSCRCRSLRPSIRDRPPSSPLGPEGPGGRGGAGPPRLGGCPRENRPKPFLRMGPSLPRNPGHVGLSIGASSDLGPSGLGTLPRRRMVSEETTGTVPRAKPPKRPPLGSGPTPSSFVPRNPLVQSPGSCGGCGCARRGHRRRPGRALFLGRRDPKQPLAVLFLRSPWFSLLALRVLTLRRSHDVGLDYGSMRVPVSW
jgi:hypothetical protein